MYLSPCRKFEERIELQNLTYQTEFASRFINGVTEFGYHTPDQFFHPNVMQYLGKRWTVAKHLVGSKPEILPNAHVERILFSHDDSNELKATGVVYSQNGMNHIVYSTKAVILAAGTVGTPAILLKSGIGPDKFYANNSKLSMQKNLPAVGNYLQDHITTGLDLVLLNESLGLEPWNIYSFNSIKSYFFNNSGPLTMTGCEALGFVRSPLANNMDDRPDLGFMVIPLGIAIDSGVHMRKIFNVNDKVWHEYFKSLIGKSTVSIMPVLLHPKSHGSLSITMDENGRWIPVIDPQYLSHSHDANVLIEGLKIVEELIQMPSFRKLNARINQKPFPGCENHAFRSHEYWDCYVRQLTLTAYHPVGTCRMGTNPSDSVVNAVNFKVHNVDSLYICDASIMPHMPSGNPQATIGMLATKFLQTFNARVKV